MWLPSSLSLPLLLLLPKSIYVLVEKLVALIFILYSSGRSWIQLVVVKIFFFFSSSPAETSFAGDFPVPPPYSVATSLPTYDEAEKAKAAAMAASAVEVIPRVSGRLITAASSCPHLFLSSVSDRHQVTRRFWPRTRP